MGVLGLTPFLQKTCPEVIKQLPDRLRELAGKRVVIDGTLITQRLHFAPAPHPYRHIQGWYRLARDLQEAGVSVVCVFDGKERNIAKAREQERRKELQRKVLARGALEIDRSKRLKQLSDILPRFWGLNDATWNHAAETLRNLASDFRTEEQARRTTTLPNPRTEDTLDRIIVEPPPSDPMTRISVGVRPVPDCVQDETLGDEEHLVADSSFFDHDLTADHIRHMPPDHPWFQEFAHLSNESHPDIYTSVGLHHLDEIHPPHEIVKLHLHAHLLPAPAEQTLDLTFQDELELHSNNEYSTSVPLEQAFSASGYVPMGSNPPSTSETHSTPFITKESHSPSIGGEAPLPSPSESPLTSEEPSLPLSVEEPSLLSSFEELPLPFIADEVPLPSTSEQPPSPSTSKEMSLLFTTEEWPSAPENPPSQPITELLVAEEVLSLPTAEPSLPARNGEVPSLSTIQPTCSPKGIESKLSDLYLDYRQSVSRFAKLSKLISPPPIPGVGDAETQAEIMMTKAQYHLTLEEGQFWDSFSVKPKEPELPGTLERLYKKSDMMSASFERRMSPPTSDTYNQSKEILRAMGVPCLETTGAFEAEALASSIVLNGLADYVVSEDTDVLVYEAPLVRNLTNKNEPLTLISGAEIRTALQLDRASFVDFALLLGTDFSQRIRRVGPARALKFIREHGSIERVLELETRFSPPLALQAYLDEVESARLVFCTLPPLPDAGLLEQQEPDEGEVIRLLQRYGMGKEVMSFTEWDSTAALAGNFFQDNPSAR